MINRIKELYKTYKQSRARKIFFFSFYFVFFLVLFIYLATSKPTSNNNDNNSTKNEVESYELDNKNVFITSKLDNDSYKYKITIQNNYNLELLEGNNNDLSSINNYKYYEILEVPRIKQMIKNAKFLSKNLYSNNRYKINYEINNYDLYKIFKSENLDNKMKNIINTIVVITDEKKQVLGFEYDFSNYFNSIDNNINIYKVIIEYEF